MARAQGVGQQPVGGGGLAGVPAYARIFCYIQPLLNTDSPGTFDANGNYLHVLYEGNLNLGSRSGGNQDTTAVDFVPNKIAVEFDGVSEFVVPYEGSIKLVGGSGDYKFGLFVIDTIDKQFYQPQIRTLMTYRDAGAPFTVPDFHTFILGTNLADLLTLPTGNDLQTSLALPGAQIISGLPLVVRANTTIITGWRG